MSVIKLKCIEQTLTIVNSPEISSGNVNHDILSVEFCETWSGFTKTAIFYRTKDEVYNQVLASDNTCKIPKEVLKSRGAFYIGVFGSKSDEVLTSNVLSYRVNEGAITENLTPPDPTPDIYAQILAEFGDVRDVYEEFKQTIVEMDNTIVVSHGYEYPNSRPGGAYLKYIEGATVQNGEPSQSTPIAIENTFDCVEMMQGYLNEGILANSNNAVCCKNYIPCNTGDMIKLSTEIASKHRVAYYDKDYKYIGYVGKDSVTESSHTVPANAKYFKFYIGSQSGDAMTPDTVGKISLTVNGKYVGQIVEHGKNLLNATDETLTASNRLGKYFNVDFECAEFVFSADVELTNVVANAGFLRMELVHEDDAVTYHEISCPTSGQVRVKLPIKFNEVKKFKKLQLYLQSGEFTSGTVRIYNKQIELGTVTDYEPYTEKVTTFFLNEPLRATDRLVRMDGVMYENHKRRSVTIDGVNVPFIYKSGETKNIGFCVDKSLHQPNCKETDGTYVMNGLLSSHGIAERHVSAISHGKPCVSENKGAIYFWFGIDTEVTSIELANAYAQANPITVEYELAEETYTPLDTQSQIALNGLETFKDVTYIEVDSKVKPSDIEVEYGVTREAGYTLKSLLNSESNAIKIDNVTSALLALSQG